MTQHSTTTMLNCCESKKYCHTVIFAGILEMYECYATQSGEISGRGCQVSPGGRSASSGGDHLCTSLRRPLSRCSGDWRLFQGGVVRISCFARMFTSRHHWWSPATAPSSKTSQVAAGLLSRWRPGRGSGCVQAAWKAQSVEEDLWQAESQRGASLHKQEPGVGEPAGRCHKCHNCCSEKQVSLW